MWVGVVSSRADESIRKKKFGRVREWFSHRNTKVDWSEIHNIEQKNVVMLQKNGVML